MTGRLLALLLLAALVVTGCDGDDDPGSPAAAPGTARAVPAAGVEPCPRAGVETSNLPTTTLPCLAGGGDTTLRAMLDGRPAIVNFWASWCRPCVAELPILQDVHETAADRVQVVGVLSNDPTDNWRDLLTRTGATFPSVRDDRRRLFADLELVGAFPVSLLVRADGTLAWVHYGDVADRAELAALVRTHLGVRL